MAISVKGGFFAQYSSVYTFLSGKPTALKDAARALAKRSGMATRELMETLNGAAAGSTAAKTLKRITASSELGGVRAVESEEIVNRATVAGDVTNINADVLSLSTRTYDSTPVANGDGNPLGTR